MPTSDTSFSYIGVLDMFKIGIGPSSSHTIGPMKAANAFIRGLGPDLEAWVERLVVTVHGSLAWTGKGHCTDKAIMLGLTGHAPETIEPAQADAAFAAIQSQGEIRTPTGRLLRFQPERDLVFDLVKQYPRHPNAMRFVALGPDQQVLADALWYSVGGGFVEQDGAGPELAWPSAVPYPFASMKELLALGCGQQLRIADMALANERSIRSDAETFSSLDRLVDVMLNCVERGLTQSGPLPGPLKVHRRAAGLFQALRNRATGTVTLPTDAFDHVSAFAMAVNEENACGGRVVTAPTNGAAGVVPAVLRYYRDFCPGATRDGLRDFILVAAATGSIIKRNASISGAEVGCQGEVGSAAAMAAAGLASALGGTNAQVENAAEIALEHHLGMTCDPVGGLVQIPCIERNAFGAVKAITAASLALLGTGEHVVSLDQVIETMRQTGADMHDKYRETSRGGLAVSFPQC
ncbi:MAG: L-serine ammonia-lyase [Pseudomonadota bacterium]